MTSFSKEKKGRGRVIQLLHFAQSILVDTAVQCADQLERCSFRLSLQDDVSVQGILRDSVVSCIQLIDEACRLLPWDDKEQLWLASGVLGLPHEGMAVEEPAWDDVFHQAYKEHVAAFYEERTGEERLSPPSPSSGDGRRYRLGEPLKGTKVSPLTEMFGVDAEELTEAQVTNGITIVHNIMSDLKKQLMDISDAELKGIGDVSLLAGLVLVHRARLLTYPLLGALTGVDFYARARRTIELIMQQQGKGVETVAKKGSKPRGLLTGEDDRKCLPWPELAYLVKGKAEDILDKGDKTFLEYIATLSWGLPATGLMLWASSGAMVLDTMARVLVDTGVGQGVTAGVEDIAILAQLGVIFTKVSLTHAAKFSCREFDRMGGWGGCGKLSVGFVAGVVKDPKGAAVACVDTVKMAGGAVGAAIRWTGQLFHCLKAKRD